MTAAKGRPRRSTFIVIYWLMLGVLATPAAFLGWRFIVGVIFGMVGYGIYLARKEILGH